MQLIYPPSHLPKTLSSLNVLQITDFHIFAKEEPHKSSLQNETNFKLALKQALDEDVDCHLILVTGDLVDEISEEIYDRIFAILEDTNIAFACISGNHDVTDEVTRYVPFHQRELVAHQPDKRLLNQHVIESEFWQLLLVDSSVPGKISGLIQDEDLQWIQQQLTQNHKPAILFLHHHITPMNSKWLDTQMLVNTDQLWQTILPFEQLKSVVHGHVHQESMTTKEHITVYGTPATSHQFKPYSDDFAIDQRDPGYRWLFLHPDGTLDSRVERVPVN